MLDLQALRQRLGGTIYDGGRRWVGRGPNHRRRDDQSLSVMLNAQGRPIVYSFAGDSLADCRAHLGLPESEGRAMSPLEARRERAERLRLQAEEKARKAAFCQAVWTETLDVRGSPMEAYLRGRGITVPIPEVVRFHPRAPLGYEGRPTSPAMVAMAQDAAGKSCGLHITAIKPDGSGKVSLPNPRRMFGDMAGATVRLATGPHSGVLAVSEGIETGLAYHQLTGLPVWACLSAPGLHRAVPPQGLERLVVAADNDTAGLDAARSLVERLKRRCAWRIDPAPGEGRDWNDVLVEGCR